MNRGHECSARQGISRHALILATVDDEDLQSIQIS